MSQGENITTKFRVDLSELKSGINEANKTIKTATAEFKNATAGIGKWSESVDGLTAKIREQETVLESEKKKLELLKQQLEKLNQSQKDGEKIISDLNAEYQKAVEAYGATSNEAKAYAKQLLDAQKAQERNAAAAEELRLKILNQDTAVKTAESNVKHYSDALETLENSAEHLKQRQQQLTDEYKEAVKQYGRNSDEAKQLKSELKNLTTQLDKAEKETEDLGDASEQLTDGFTVAKGAVAGFIANGLTNLVSAVGGAITGIAGLSGETREFRSTMASLENSAKKAGYTTEETAETFSTLQGVLGDTQAAATTTANLQAIGLEQSKLEEITDGVIGAWSTYGDSIPIDGLGEAINHSLQLGEVQGTLADVIEWGGKDIDTFNKALSSMSSETERADYISTMFAQMGLSDAGKAWQENNASIVEANNAQHQYEEQTAKLGAIIEPITTKIRDGFGQIVGKVVELVEKADFKKIETAIDEGFTYFIDTVIPAIVDGFTWIIENKDGLIAGIVGIGTAFLAFKVVSIIQAVTSALQGMSVAQAALNLVMSMNPIGLVIAAIAGLVAAFVVLWNKSDAFREFWIGLWKKIKSAVEPVLKWISDTFSKTWDKIKGVWEKVSPYFEKLFSGIFNFVKKYIGTWIDIYKNVWDAIKVVWDKVSPYFNALISGISDFVKKYVSAWITIYKNVWDAIKVVWDKVSPYFKMIFENIKAVFSHAKAVLGAFFKAAWESIKAVWDNVTKYFKAIWDTIKGIFSVVKSVLTGDFKGAWDGIKGIVSTWASYFSGVWGNIKKVFSSVASYFKTTFASGWNAVKNVFSNVGTFFGGIWDTIKSKFSAFGTKIGDAIGGTFKTAINAVIGTVEKGLNLIPNTVNKAISAINELPGVEIGKLSTISLPRLARGGIVDRSTIANIGEDGAEAIIPLEKNKGGLKQIARLISAEMKSATGATGGTVGGTVNYNFNQTNNSPKALSRYDVYRQSKILLNAVKGV